MGKRAEVEVTVVRTQQIAPILRRIVFGGPGASELLANDSEATDKYVKLIFGDAKRTYTLRWTDHEAGEFAIDFVVHGDEGLAGPWAERATVGDSLRLVGPGGAYRPKADIDHHLFVGDESAIPAIAASLEALAPSDRATAFIEVDGADDEIAFKTPADVTIQWLHRAPEPAGSTTLLVDAVKDWDVPAGRIQAFVHGESALLKSVRPYLLDGIVARPDISVSAYWRRGVTEEGFREWKAQQAEAIMVPENS